MACATSAKAMHLAQRDVNMIAFSLFVLNRSVTARVQISIGRTADVMIVT